MTTSVQPTPRSTSHAFHPNAEELLRALAIAFELGEQELANEEEAGPDAPTHLAIPLNIPTALLSRPSSARAVTRRKEGGAQ